MTMRKILSLFLVMLAALVLSGMSGLGDQPTGKAPETPEDIRVTLIDRQDRTVELSQFSMDGNIYIKGDVGSGNLTVPMTKIKRVSFGTVRGEFVPVTVRMKTDEKIDLRLSKRADFFGNMGVGAYRVEASQVRKISFR